MNEQTTQTATQKVDELIYTLSDHIQGMIDEGMHDSKEISRLTDSLANLISSRKAENLSPLMEAADILREPLVYDFSPNVTKAYRGLGSVKAMSEQIKLEAVNKVLKLAEDYGLTVDNLQEVHRDACQHMQENATLEIMK